MDKRINEHGNEVIDEFCPGNRYKYDFHICTSEKGWIQYDTNQDAHYFGIWVNPERKEVFIYCEGDTSLVICKNEQTYKEELAGMAKFYGDPPPAFTAIDTTNKTITKYYVKRPK